MPVRVVPSLGDVVAGRAQRGELAVPERAVVQVEHCGGRERHGHQADAPASAPAQHPLGALPERAQATAAESGIHLVWPTYEAGPERGTVYNSAAVIGPTGDVLGVYRKTHLFPAEQAWVTPGDDVLVVGFTL